MQLNQIKAKSYEHIYDKAAFALISKIKTKPNSPYILTLTRFALLLDCSSITIEDDFLDFVDYLRKLKFKDSTGMKSLHVFKVIVVDIGKATLTLDEEFAK